MISKGKLVLVILCLFPVTLLSQEPAKGFRVDSSPPGAEVSLDGAVLLSGLTPVTFTQALDGSYKIRVVRHGYETYKSSVYIQPDRDITLTVRLKPKTRLKAAARSLFIPGWGQSYADQKFKGNVFTILAAGAVASYLITDSRFDTKNNHYNSILGEYNSALTYQDKVRLNRELRDAKNDAYDAETIRRVAIGATVAVWALNVLDILFFFPEEGGSIAVNSIGVRPTPGQGGAQLVLSHSF